MLGTLVDQQGQIMSMLATIITQTKKVPEHHPRLHSSSSHQQPLPATENIPTLTDNFFLEDLAAGEKTDIVLTDDDLALLS